MNLLIFLTHPEPTRSGYQKYLAPRHPELTITTVGTRDQALKLAPDADILMAFGPQVKKDLLPAHAEAEMGAFARHRYRRHHRLAVSRQGRGRYRDARHSRPADLGKGLPV